jgi:two-component system NtrC family sensor kinase
MIPSVEKGLSVEARNRWILVIDDNSAIHENFRKILCPEMPAADALLESEVALFGKAQMPHAEAGFAMNSALQGEEALKLIVAALEENRPYAIAFLDMRMPAGWDGIETATRIWQRDPHLQIVLSTHSRSKASGSIR